MNRYSRSSQPHVPPEPLPARQARSQRTRDRLLKAGNHLIASTTLDNLTVAQIAAAAGCSVGAFYQRFEDKEAFFAALVVDMMDEVRVDLLDVYQNTVQSD